MLHDGQALAWVLIAKGRTPTRWLKASAGRMPPQSVSQAGRVLRAEVQDCIEEKNK